MKKKPQDTYQNNHRILFRQNDLNLLANEFLAEKKLQGLVADSIKNYIYVFESFSFLRLKDFDRRDFIEFCCQETAHQHWANSTRSNHLRKLCSFNRFLFYQSQVLRLHRAPNFSNKPKRRDLPTSEEWEKLFDALRLRYENSTIGRRKTRWRDYIVCRILRETGIRISEAAGLRVRDFVIHDVGQYFLYILPEASTNNSLKTEDAERAVVISEKLCEEIRAYLWTFRIQNKAARMFTSKTGGEFDKIEFCKWLKLFAASCGIEADITPHIFRHAFIFDWIAAGGGAIELMARLGHSDIKMTVYYFKQVRRLLPFVKVNPDINLLETKYTARARYFQNKLKTKKGD